MNRLVRLLAAAALAAVAAGTGTASADEDRDGCPPLVWHSPCPVGCSEVIRFGPEWGGLYTYAVCMGPIL